jgi:hypothetical protein
MNPILVVIPYHSADLEITRKLIAWIAELGSCKPHSLLFAADSAIPQETMRELMDAARPVFHSVKTMIITVPKPAEGQRVWPPNIVFLAVANQVHQLYKFPFLFLEPDAIPIYAGWIDDIAEEYAECPARFMGSIVKQVGQPGLPSEYLNGVAVYPNDAIEVFEKIASVKDSSQAWDIGSASVVVPRAMNTKLIAHFYGEKDLPPMFVQAKLPDSPKNHVTLDFVPMEAAIFHRSKDGKLIDLLMARRKSATPIPESVSLKTQTSDTGPVKFSNVIVPELKEHPVALAPVVDMLPVETQELAPIGQPEKRGPGRPKKVEATA